MDLVLLAAISLDGFITRHDEPGSGFTSPEDKRYFHRAVLAFDALIFGSANYEVSRSWISAKLRADQLKVVVTRSPKRYEAEKRPDELEFTAAAPGEIIRDLKRRGRKRVCLMGGGKIYGLFLAAGVVDELWVTVEPRLFGEGTRLSEVKLDATLDLISSEKLNSSTLLLKYRPRPQP